MYSVLREREFRLLTGSLGNAVGTIALAFAVLEIEARQVASASVLLIPAVWRITEPRSAA